MSTVGNISVLEVTMSQAGRTFYLFFSIAGFTPDDYKVISHILPDYGDIAKKIANNMGIDPTQLSTDFLK